ncbi:MAG: CPBP family intramembrane metalloprotease [Firmicutes bacterium]|nr:CPBP family intramembrane metalloprotease [Bacillota bacterium]
MKPVPEHEYPTYPRRFLSYRWFKPILVALIFGVIYFGATIALVAAGAIATGGFNFVQNIAGGYDTMEVSTAQGALLNLGSLAIAIPILALAALIMRDRPFSSYSSARGGWDWGLFAKLMLIAFIVCGVPILVLELIDPYPFNNQFTAAGFILLTILGPLQCVAEEYIFRGLLMQTFGGWFRIPVIAVILQAAIFMSMHPYNMVGRLTILATGCAMGLMAWISRGIEASSAIHIVNNMVSFYLAGFGLSPLSSEISVEGLLVTVAIDAVYVLVLLYLRRKGWFDRIKKDDVAEFNAKVEAKYAKKYVLNWKPGVAGPEVNAAAGQKNEENI